jgi:hypothetical protein
MSRVGGQAPHGTKDKGGSKSRKKARAKTLKQERQTKKAKQAGGTAK